MTGQDFYDRQTAIVLDLQTKGKGKTVNVMLRDEHNQPNVFLLSSDANGVVNAAQLSALDNAIADLMALADDYNTNTAPYTAKAAELKVIAESQAYIDARAIYKQYNLSENFAELQDAKGAYVL